MGGSFATSASTPPKCADGWEADGWRRRSHSGSRRLRRTGSSWQADRFALDLTRAHPSTFAAALRRLAQLNLADPNPPRWLVWMFYDHPPITERIAAADAPSLQQRKGDVQGAKA